MLHGLHGKDLIIASNREEAYTIGRRELNLRKDEFFKLKLTSGRGERLKTYRVTIYRK